MDIKYSEKAVKQLKRIKKGDKKSVRIIIEEINDTIYIYEIKHRQEAYND